MPTMKQIKAVKALGETGGVISKAMAKAGYAPSVTHATEKLTNSDGWKELMGKYLDDKKLVKKHDQLLNAESESVQLNAVKLGYEVKGKIQNVLPPPVTQTVNINFFSNPAIIKATKTYDEQLKQALIDSYENKESAETLQAG